jgi:Protein of unknown function (DUF3800)
VAQFDATDARVPDAPPVTHPAVGYFHESLPLRFPPSVQPINRLIMNIYGYFDESGTHKGSRALSVGGFLGRADEWAVFGLGWEELLASFHIDYFHMADFESRHGAYKSWSEERRREFVRRALGLIGRHVIGSVGNVLPLSDYDEVFPIDEPPEPPNRQEFAPGILTPWSLDPGEPEPKVDLRAGDIRRKSGGPYGLAVLATINDTAHMVRPLAGDPHVAYVFEKGAVGRGQADKVILGMLRDEQTRREFRMLSVAFEDKRDFPPLQVADLLAYELHKHLPRQLGLEKRPTRYTLHELAKPPRSWGWINEDQLAMWHYVIGRGLYYSKGPWRE